MPSSAFVFIAAAGAAAVLHALIPDHWLPFVLMGRSRRWSLARTLALAGAGGIIHVCLAVGLGVAVIALGRSGAEAAARRAGETLEFLSAIALALFGFLYGALSWWRERRHHAAPDGGAGHGASEEGHHHGHLLERWFRADLTALSLVVVIGVSPCALALPILLASAASLGVGGVLVVAASFGAVTLITTVGITLFAVLGTRNLDFPLLSRYGDLASGILIGLVGTLLALSEIFPG